MRVLHIASECAPLVKTGGLADVVGALPSVLAAEGVEAKVLLPGYPAVMAKLEKSREIALPDGLEGELTGGPARLLEAEAAGLSLLVLDAPARFRREGGIYETNGRDWPDNAYRFGAFAKLGALIAARGMAGGAEGWRPDVLHAHDWQAGLAPFYLDLMGRPVPSVITIHNISYQGLFDPTALTALGIPQSTFSPDRLEFWGQVGFLKAGLVTADAITTVSPGYAREILTPEFGMGLEGVLTARDRAVSGILNGADTTVWNPAADPLIAAPYASPEGKAANRAALLERFGIEDGPGPVLGLVSRLTRQKGIDLLLKALPGFLAAGGRVALLGSGEASLEAALTAAAAQNPGRVGVFIGYDEALSHLVYAGSDAIAVPSRFEPCGLTQLYALRYGATPVVARTGGLGDTVIDANPAALAAGVATGFVHAPGDASDCAHALQRLATAYADRETWARLTANAMAHPVDWGPSAAAYAALYRRLAGQASAGAQEGEDGA
ncbi:MAG: glycogen synthase GlgA [Pseudomonadota bacterium]